MADHELGAATYAIRAVIKSVSKMDAIRVAELECRWQQAKLPETIRELVYLGHVTRARVTQIMNLRLLAPEIQDCLLSLPRITRGQDTVSLRSLQWVALQPEWKQQRRQWKELKGQSP